MFSGCLAWSFHISRSTTVQISPSKKFAKCSLTLRRNFPRSLRETITGFDILIEIRNWTALELAWELWSSENKCLPFFSPSPLSPLLQSLSATVPMLLSNKGGVPRAGVPQECQPFPSLACKSPLLLAQLAEELCKRQSGLGEAQHLAWVVGKWEASTKSFQTKGINIIYGAIRLPGAQYVSGLATCFLPKFCMKAW